MVLEGGFAPYMSKVSNRMPRRLPKELSCCLSIGREITHRLALPRYTKVSQKWITSLRRLGRAQLIDAFIRPTLGTVKQLCQSAASLGN